MSIDKTLNLTAKVKPIIVNQEDARRRRLIRRIENQLVILQAVKIGELPAKPYKRLSRWWWTQDGKYYVFLQYARKPLLLAKDRYSVEVTDLNGVMDTLKILSSAVEKGEFDKQILENSSQIRKRFEVGKSSSPSN
jgi:hypothetical protein